MSGALVPAAGSPAARGVVYYPRFRVTMNGTLLQGVVEVTVDPPCASQVGKFHFSKAFVPGDQFPPAWWAATDNKTMQVQIEFSPDGVSFTQTILGGVDSHAWEVTTNTLQVAGRDKAALLLDTRTVATHRNQTSSEVAQALAAEHGLQASITATTIPVGRYYDTDHDHTSGGDFSTATNEWDLLCRLGSKEGFVPYVQGNTLYFNPPPANPPVFFCSATIDEQGNIISDVEGMQLERHLTAAHDVVVTVVSWHSRKKASFSATVRTKTKKSNSAAAVTNVSATASTNVKSAGNDPKEPPSKFLVPMANLTQAQCLAEATKLALEISQHERSVNIRAPWLVLLSPATVAQVAGTGTDYDMNYYPRQMSVRVAFDGGAETTINAKFSSPVFVYDDDTGEQIGEQAA